MQAARSTQECVLNFPTFASSEASSRTANVAKRLLPHPFPSVSVFASCVGECVFRFSLHSAIQLDTFCFVVCFELTLAVLCCLCSLTDKASWPSRTKSTEATATQAASKGKQEEQEATAHGQQQCSGAARTTRTNEELAATTTTTTTTSEQRAAAAATTTTTSEQRAAAAAATTARLIFPFCWVASHLSLSHTQKNTVLICFVYFACLACKKYNLKREDVRLQRKRSTGDYLQGQGEQGEEQKREKEKGLASTQSERKRTTNQINQ